MQVQFVPI